jgi:hypothetical protein
MALGSDRKGKVTLVILIVDIGCAFWEPLVSAGFFALVDAIWLVPDRRIERALATARTQAPGGSPRPLTCRSGYGIGVP